MHKLGVLLDPLCAAQYPQRTVDPGARPVYAPNAGAVAQRNTENIFAINYRAHHNEKHMDQALIDRMFQCIGPDKAQDLRDNLVNVVNPTFLQESQAAIDLWGHTTPSSRAANVETLKAPWHPQDGVARLWRMIKDDVTYAVAAGHLIPPNQIEDAALISINRSQAYKQAYLSYRQLPLRNYNVL